MTQQSPQNLSIVSVKNSFSIEDTVWVRDSAVYQVQKWKYLVKKQMVNSGENELLVWLDELANQGWELISQSVNLGFYIFKKPAQ